MKDIFSLMVVLTVTMVAAIPSVGLADGVSTSADVVVTDAPNVGRSLGAAHVAYPWVVYYDSNGYGLWLEYGRYADWYYADLTARNLYLNFGYKTRILYRWY